MTLSTPADWAALVYAAGIALICLYAFAANAWVGDWDEAICAPFLILVPACFWPFGLWALAFEGVGETLECNT
jgi:hypothetical protein